MIFKTYSISPNAGVGKLSSERHLPLRNSLSCPRSRPLSCVTFKGDYVNLVVRNCKIQADMSHF